MSSACVHNKTVCVSRSENGPCFQTLVTSERQWVVENLNAETTYYIRVLASTKVGQGNYSESKGFLTSSSEYNINMFIFDLCTPDQQMI